MNNLENDLSIDGLQHDYEYHWDKENQKIILIHRYVAQKKLKRPLTSADAVHHIDGNKRNNKSDNLLILSHSDHIKLHESVLYKLYDNPDGSSYVKTLFPIKETILLDKYLDGYDGFTYEELKTVAKKCDVCSKLFIHNNRLVKYCSKECKEKMIPNLGKLISKEQLIKDLEEIPTQIGIARKYGVSDNSIKNLCIQYGLYKRRIKQKLITPTFDSCLIIHNKLKYDYNLNKLARQYNADPTTIWKYNKLYESFIHLFPNYKYLDTYEKFDAFVDKYTTFFNRRHYNSTYKLESFSCIVDREFNLEYQQYIYNEYANGNKNILELAKEFNCGVSIIKFTIIEYYRHLRKDNEPIITPEQFHRCYTHELYEYEKDILPPNLQKVFKEKITKDQRYKTNEKTFYKLVKLTYGEVEQIFKIKKEQQISNIKISKMFNVNRSTIDKILKGESYKWWSIPLKEKYNL